MHSDACASQERSEKLVCCFSTFDLLIDCVSKGQSVLGSVKELANTELRTKNTTDARRSFTWVELRRVWKRKSRVV